MSKPFKGTISNDIQDSTQDWAPSVLYVVLDDVGFSALESYGEITEQTEQDSDRVRIRADARQRRTHERRSH